MAIQYRSPHIYRNIFKYQGDTPQFSMRACISPVYDMGGGTIYDDRRFTYDGYPAGPPQSLTNQTLTMRAWITGPYRLTLRARVSRHHGWPVPAVTDPGYSIWQDTRLDFRARITNFIAVPTQTFRMKGRVTYGKTLGLQSKARIVTAGFMSMRANILPKFFTVHVPMQFSVRRTSQTRLRVVFCTQGNSHNQSMSLKARIAGVYTARMTGHFIVAAPLVFNSVLAIENPITLARTQQLLSTRARIVK